MPFKNITAKLKANSFAKDLKSVLVHFLTHDNN